MIRVSSEGVMISLFCQKCGKQISEHDQFCTNCGAENLNFIPNLEKNNSSRNDADKSGSAKKLVKIIVPVALVIVVLLVLVFSLREETPSSSFSYSPSAIPAYLVDDEGAYFKLGNDLRFFKGNIFYGRATPNKSKFIILYTDRRLVVCDNSSKDDASELEISNNVFQVEAVNDYGCYYFAGKKEDNAHLWFYNFGTSENTDIGFENSKLYFSAGLTSVIGVDKDSLEMSIYTYTDDKPKALCKFDEVDSIESIENSGILCVADDGSNTLWYKKIGSQYSIFTIKNGAPERIAKISNPSEYSSICGRYFDNDQSFIVYSVGSGQILLNSRGILHEISLPGVLVYSGFIDLRGFIIDSDDDFVDPFILFIKKNIDSDVGSVYQMTTDGNLSLEIDGVCDSKVFPIIVDNCLYFLNKDNDFQIKAIGNDTVDSITTDVTNFSISPNGKYAYISKSGSLYYLKTDDKTKELTLITSDFLSDDKLYLTDQDDIIYYIHDFKEIDKNKYIEKGTAYLFTVGKEPEKIANDAIDIHIDERYVNSTTPLIEVFDSLDENDYINRNYGTISDGKFKILFSNS